MVEGADWTDRVGGGAPTGDMAVSPAVLTLSLPIGRVCSLNCPGGGEKTDGGAHCWDVPPVDGDDDGGGRLALPGLRVGVEISGGEDPYVLGVKD